MKPLISIRIVGALVVSLFLTSCDDANLKGTLRIALTDAPIDADGVKSVNLIITNIEGKQGDQWKSIKNFEQPTGVNLLALTGGKSAYVIDQFTNPGELSSLRISLNTAIRNSSLIVSPQSNIIFKDGRTAPLYMEEGILPEIILDQSIGVSSRGITDITLDIDLRKSIHVNSEGEYILNPVARFVNTRKSGNAEIHIQNQSIPSRMNIYAYKRGSFNSSELTPTNRAITFFNAVTSSAIKDRKVVLGFLEAGDYDLVFVKHDDTGTETEIVGLKSGVSVQENEQVIVDVDVEALSPS